MRISCLGRSPSDFQFLEGLCTHMGLTILACDLLLPVCLVYQVSYDSQVKLCLFTVTMFRFKLLGGCEERLQLASTTLWQNHNHIIKLQHSYTTINKLCSNKLLSWKYFAATSRSSREWRFRLFNSQCKIILPQYHVQIGTRLSPSVYSFHWDEGRERHRWECAKDKWKGERKICEEERNSWGGGRAKCIQCNSN